MRVHMRTHTNRHTLLLLDVPLRFWKSPPLALLSLLVQAFSHFQFRKDQDKATGYKGKIAWRPSDWIRCGPFLPSVTPRPQSCPPWRCHTDYSVSCAAHTFCPDAEETKCRRMPTEPRDQCVHTGPEFQISHSGQEQTSASRFLYIENSQVKKIKLEKEKKQNPIPWMEWELPGNFRVLRRWIYSSYYQQ